jgi:hypothetical protein
MCKQLREVRVKALSLTPLVLILATLAPAPVGATTITFETVSVNGCTDPLTTTVSDGFTFTSLHHHVCDGTSVNFVSNESNYLALEVATSVTMTESEGTPFSLTGFDLGEVELPPAAAYAPYLDITGLLVGGGTVTTARILLDGLADGAGGVSDFQPVILTGFDNLLSVTFTGFTQPVGGTPTSIFSLDNIDATPVPEPASILLVGAGLVGAVKRFRRVGQSTRS